MIKLQSLVKGTSKSWDVRTQGFKSRKIHDNHNSPTLWTYLSLQNQQKRINFPYYKFQHLLKVPKILVLQVQRFQSPAQF